MTLESFDKILSDRTSIYHKIDKGSYLSKGLYPIIDQGKSDIAGFTNDRTLIVDSKRPFIIFGDHTRIFKYVDFPTAIGADGVKVLYVSERAIPKYVYYYLKSIRLPDAGYSRHFKFLKNVKIPIIALEDQTRIATVLSKAEVLIAQRKESIRLLDEFLKSTFLEMFGDYDIKKRTKDFLGNHISYLTSGSRGWAQYYSDRGAKFLRIQNIGGGVIKSENIVFVNPPKSAETERTRVQEGDLIMSITADLGRTSAVPKNFGEAYINQHLALIRLNANINPIYAAYFYNMPFGNIEIQKKNRAAVKAGLNFNDIKSLPILIPPITIQNKFALIVEKTELLKSVYQSNLSELENLFGSLSQKAFKGQLDLTKLGVVIPDTEPLTAHFEKATSEPIRKIKGKRTKTVKEYFDPFEGKAIPEDRLMTLAEAKKILGKEYGEISDEEEQSKKIDSAWLQARTLPVNERGRIKFNNAEGWAILDAIFFDTNLGFTSNEFMTFLQKEGIAFDSDTIANFFANALDKKRIVQRYSKNTEVETGRTDSAKQENIIWFAHNVVDK